MAALKIERSKDGNLTLEFEMGLTGVRRWFFIGHFTQLFSVVSVESRNANGDLDTRQSVWERILKGYEETKTLLDLANADCKFEDVEAYLVLLKAPVKVRNAKFL